MASGGQHGEDHVGHGDGPGRRGGGLDPGRGGLRQGLGDEVVAEYPVAGRGQVGGHRAAHVPEPDERDGPAHQTTSSLVSDGAARPSSRSPRG